MGIRKLLCFVLFILLGPQLMANDEAAPSHESSDGGGEHGGGHEAGAPGEKEYRDKTTKLNSYETKIYEAESLLQNLIEHKNHTKNKKEALQIVEHMKEVKKEYDENIEKFNLLREELEYKFPDKGRVVHKRYAPMQKKSMEEIEKKSTLDTDLTSAKKTAEKVYRPFIKKAEEEERKNIEENNQKKLHAPKDEDETPKKIQFVK